MGKAPKLFYFVNASSGMGKSQLAESLDMPVVYIPLSASQDIYKCFFNVSSAVNAALDSDVGDLMGKSGGVGIMTAVKSTMLNVGRPFRTVGLLVALFEEVYGKSNEDSLKLLSGYNADLTIHYEPMSLSKARNKIADRLDVKCFGKIPLFIIDEVPSKENDTTGTEASAMNALDNVSGGSRVDHEGEFLRLITKLPPTNWSLFSSDQKYADLIKLLPDNLCDMLKRTRPLFAQYVLNELLVENVPLTGQVQLTSTVLSAVKKKILKEKRLFASEDGLFAQLALLNADYIKFAHVEKNDFFQPQTCVRHHFGRMDVSNQDPKIVNDILSLFLPDGGRICKVKVGDGSEEESFSPQ
eukprot:gene42120-52219_t